MENSILQKVKDTEKLFEGYEIIAGELSRVRALRQKLEQQHVTVSVIGQFKRGKSALVNGILGRDILPMGIVPVTAVVTTVEYGKDSAEVHFSNGKTEKVSFEQISEYINEQQNMDNHLNVTKVAIKCESEFLHNNLTFVDTPGVGSLHEKNSEEAYAFVKESDAVIFTLSVDSPINQIEIDFLKNAKTHAAKFYFAVNKTDVVAPEDLKAYISYCEKFIAQIMEVEKVMLFPVSAKAGTGIDALKNAILTDLSTQTGKILKESAELKLQDIVLSALSEITLYRKALSMTGAEFDKKFEDMKSFFNQLHDETDTLPAALKANREVCRLHANDVKNRLTLKVKELFGIDYKYDMDEIYADKDITEVVDDICSSLDSTLNTIFMHREENTYVVSKRIYKLNELVRKLVRMRDGR